MKKFRTVLTLIMASVLIFSSFVFVHADEAFSENIDIITAPANKDRVSLCLKDNWHVYVDSSDSGEKEEWYKGFLGGGRTVSLPYESSADGYTDVIWFGTEFNADFELNDGERTVLDFEGVQYYAKIWLNGSFIGEHYGSYGRFSIDVTDYIRPGEMNLLALRLVTPRGGSSLNGVPDNSTPVWLGGFQHIQTPVYVKVVPDVNIADTYVDADYNAGSMDVELTLNNAGFGKSKVTVNAAVKESGETGVLKSVRKTFRVAPGENTVKFSIPFKDFKAWSPDEPNLYEVSFDVSASRSEYTDHSSVTVGFKDLRIDDEGYFCLNGKRFFLKSCHTAPYVIGSVDVGADIERQLHQLDYLKSCGFNTVRFLDGPALPEMLDYCDRIGLMTYQEDAMSWTQVDCDSTKELFANEITQLTMRDRNHVSFAMIGMLNETFGKNETAVRYEAALEGPKTVRLYDDDVLIMLSSGRWDYDKTVASACNPGSVEWDAYMGNEGEDGAKGENAFFNSTFSGMGDIHYYPYMPYDAETGDAFRAIGDVRASLVSEAGAGSQPNIISDYFTFYQEENIAMSSGMNTSISKQLNTLNEMFNKFNVGSIYSSKEDIIRESERLQSKQRSLLVDYMRSNPKINGYSMTQGSDIGYRGEGILEGAMTHKDNMFNSLLDCWSDLRWCINLRDYNLYDTDELQLTVDLSDIGKLDKEKKYTANVYITGGGKTVWSKTVDVSSNGTFVIPVINESIPLTGLKTGEYKISAVLCGANASSSKSFWVTAKSSLASLKGMTIYQYGCPENVLKTFTDAGANIVEYTGQDVPEKSTIVFGKTNANSDLLNAAFEAANTKGCHVTATAWDVYTDYGYTKLPFDRPGIITNASNWLYHSESIIFDTAITAGQQKLNCLVDPLYYEDVYDAHYFYNLEDPDEVHAFSFFMGNDGGVTEQELLYGVTCGTFYYGKGFITVCTFDLNTGAGAPDADIFLLNMANYLNTK